MGGKPSKGTSADRRLKVNRPGVVNKPRRESSQNSNKVKVNKPKYK